MRRLSIRWRLTLWYGAVLSAILVGFCTAVYLLMERQLLSLTDATLREELDALVDLVQERFWLFEEKKPRRADEDADFVEGPAHFVNGE